MILDKALKWHQNDTKMTLKWPVNLRSLDWWLCPQLFRPLVGVNSNQRWFDLLATQPAVKRPALVKPIEITPIDSVDLLMAAAAAAAADAADAADAAG